MKSAKVALFVASVAFAGVVAAQVSVNSRMPIGLSASSSADLWSASHPNDPVAMPWAAGGAATTVASASASDTAAGTGARTIRVGCVLDSADSFQYTAEVVSMNGATPVALAAECRTVLDARVLTAGSGGTNAGVIQVLHSSTVLAEITAGRGAAETSVYTVTDREACLVEISAGISPARAADFTLWAKPDGAVWYPVVSLATSDYGESEFEPRNSVCFKRGTDVRVTVTSPSAAVAGTVTVAYTLN